MTCRHNQEQTRMMKSQEMKRLAATLRTIATRLEAA